MKNTNNSPIQLESQSRMFTLSKAIQVGSIKATLLAQVFCGPDFTNMDIEFIDVEDIHFFDVPVDNDYKSFQNFKTTQLSFGINIDKILDDEFEAVFTEDVVKQIIMGDEYVTK